MTNTDQNIIITQKLRFNFPRLQVPRVSNFGGNPKYSIVLMISETDTANLTLINGAIRAAILNRWGQDAPVDLKLPLHEGSTERPDRPEYAGHFYLNASSAHKPEVCDSNKLIISDLSQIYSGCYGRAIIQFYAYDFKGNRGVSCELLKVQKLEDGERIVGRTRADNVDF